MTGGDGPGRVRLQILFVDLHHQVRTIHHALQIHEVLCEIFSHCHIGLVGQDQVPICLLWQEHVSLSKKPASNIVWEELFDYIPTGAMSSRSIPGK